MPRTALALALLVAACSLPGPRTRVGAASPDAGSPLAGVGMGVAMGGVVAGLSLVAVGSMFCTLAGDHGEPDERCMRSLTRTSGTIIVAGLLVGGTIVVAAER